MSLIMDELFKNKFWFLILNNELLSLPVVEYTLFSFILNSFIVIFLGTDIFSYTKILSSFNYIIIGAESGCL